jgi:internalin A
MVTIILKEIINSKFLGGIEMNKQFLKGLILGILSTFILGTILVFSENIKHTIEVVFDSVNLEINGEEIKVDNILYEGTTYIPIRKVAELLGNEVEWDQKTRTATIKEVINSSDEDKEPKEKGEKEEVNKATTSKIINFSEKSLEKLVREIINKPNGNIMRDDVENITSLSFSNPTKEDEKICDLDSLKHFVNLKELILDNHKISNLKPLESLTNLEKLSLNGNNIEDINSLANLTNLKALYLSRNRIKEIDALKNLASLKILALNGNKISNIEGIKNKDKLEQLYLSENNIKDISDLEGITNLQVLYLYHNKIEDISPIGDLKRLRNLSLNKNEIIDIKPLNKLAVLEKLVIKNNKISNITPVSNLKNLKILYLAGNDIKDFSPINEIYKELKDKDFVLETNEKKNE